MTSSRIDPRAASGLEQTGAPDATSPPVRQPPVLRIVGGWGLGLAGAIVGLSPWLAFDPRLPLQNLWAQPTRPEDMPLALLPISQYYVSTVAALLIIGGVALGVVTRKLSQRGFSATPVSIGLVTAHTVVVVQSFSVLFDGLDLRAGGDPRVAVYLVGMLAGTVLAAVAAQVAFWLTSRRAVGPVALGLVLSAVPLGSWMGVWFVALAGVGGVTSAAAQAVHWLPALVVALALAWAGVTPPRRIAIWVVGLAVLCFAPPIITAATGALGSRSLQGDPAETVRVGLEVLRSAIWSGVGPTAWAVVLAAVLTVVLVAARRSAERT